MGTEGGEEGGGVNDPIHIYGPDGQQSDEDRTNLSFEQYQKLEQARFGRRASAGVMIFLGLVGLSLLVPFAVWLTRLAGGW